MHKHALAILSGVLVAATVVLTTSSGVCTQQAALVAGVGQQIYSEAAALVYMSQVHSCFVMYCIAACGKDANDGTLLSAACSGSKVSIVEYK